MVLSSSLRVKICRVSVISIDSIEIMTKIVMIIIYLELSLLMGS